MLPIKTILRALITGPDYRDPLCCSGSVFPSAARTVPLTLKKIVIVIFEHSAQLSKFAIDSSLKFTRVSNCVSSIVAVQYFYNTYGVLYK